MEEKDYNELDSSNEEKKVKRKNIDKEKNKEIDTHFLNTDAESEDRFMVSVTPIRIFSVQTTTAGIVPIAFFIARKDSIFANNYVLFIIIETIVILLAYLLPILLLIRVRNRYDSYTSKQKKKWKALIFASVIFTEFFAWFAQGFLPGLYGLLIIVPIIFFSYGGIFAFVVWLCWLHEKKLE